MKEQDQIKALAKLDGWNHWFNGWNKLQDNTTPLLLTEQLPRYLTSYDAIIPLIQKQPEHIRRRIAHFLHWEFWDKTIELETTERSEMQAYIEFGFSRTPAQLCEALLRATGKWKN